MSLSLDDIIFKSRALAQTHPFTRRAQAFVNRTIARETRQQPSAHMASWATFAITVGYCLRRIEESDNSKVPPPQNGPSTPGDVEALDERSDQLAEAIQQDQASEFLLWPEPVVIDALDRMIGGEIDRRLSDLSEKVDSDTMQELESYIGWWTLKGYCLRVAEQLVDAGSEELHQG